MKRKLWTPLLALLGAALALCVGASATEVSTADALTGDSVDLNGEYKLIADITIDRSIVINKEKSVTLDLNGHVLNLTDTSGGDSWITVEGGGNLTITDSSPTVPHNFEPNADGLWVLNENGTKSVTGGVITGGTGYPIQFGSGANVYDAYYGGAVYIKPGGKLTMEGGNIVGCSAVYGGGVYVAGEFVMTGGSIIGCAADRGGGVCMRDNDAVFNMSGSAAIRYCKAASKDTSYAPGGGVYALGAFTMSGNAAISNCECITGSGRAAGGGVYVSYHNENTTFTMSGSAVIENCKVTASSQNSWTGSYGGGVLVSSRSSLTLKDQAAIRKCSAKNTAGGATYGGGIFAEGTLTIAGLAEVDKDCSAAVGSGIYMEVGSDFIVSQNLYANGGVIAGEVVLNSASKHGATLKITGSDEGVTEFKGSVLNNNGIIEKGKFTGEVTNNGSITGGEFTGTVINSESGTIAEDVSIPNLIFIVTFDNEGTRTTAIIDDGGKLTAPAAPTKEGYRFDRCPTFIKLREHLLLNGKLVRNRLYKAFLRLLFLTRKQLNLGNQVFHKVAPLCRIHSIIDCVKRREDSDHRLYRHLLAFQSCLFHQALLQQILRLINLVIEVIQAARHICAAALCILVIRGNAVNIPLQAVAAAL